MSGDSTATATGLLRNEHQLILAVAHSLAGRLDAERTGVPLDYEAMGSYITFFRLFADACHHGKEEDMLFPSLEDQGLPHDTGPIAVMLYEHEVGRGLVRTMAESLDAAAQGDSEPGERLRAAAGGFIDLIGAHIGKEDNILFKMADEMIVGPGCRDLCARYDSTCGRRYEGRTKQELEKLAAAILGSR